MHISEIWQKLMTKEKRQKSKGELEGWVDESEPWIAPSHTWRGWPSDSRDWLSFLNETPTEPNARLHGERQMDSTYRNKMTNSESAQQELKVQCVGFSGIQLCSCWSQPPLVTLSFLAWRVAAECEEKSPYLEGHFKGNKSIMIIIFWWLYSHQNMVMLCSYYLI